MPRYTATCYVRVGGRRISPHASVDTREATAAPLVESGALVPATGNGKGGSKGGGKKSADSGAAAADDATQGEG